MILTRLSRSAFRLRQRHWLKRATGENVLLLQAANPSDERVVMDRRQFDSDLRRIDALAETLGIMADRRLFGQIMAAAETLGDDVRLGKLHSLKEAFE